MAEGGSSISNVDEETLFKEEFAHVEELLISSREECIEIGSKFHDLSLKVENMMQLQETSSSDHSVASEYLEQDKEVRNDFEEFKNKYESRITTYKLNSEHQARIVDDLQSRVEEYRIRCAKLEAALAEHTAHEASFTAEADSHSQNVLAMDLDTALLQLEQEKNKCQGLSQINTLLHEQLEIATEVNQTLTSDVQRLTKEWQQARSQLLAKESEWKEEEQYFSFYYTKESNILLSLWRQVLNFRHDFANLRSYTERELSSFKGCICSSIQNVTDAQIALVNRSQRIVSESEVDAALKVEDYDRNKIEITSLQERISELCDKHEDIQKLLEEKEKANSILCSTIEKISESAIQTKVQSSAKETQQEKLLSQYSKAIEDISQVLMDDESTEISSIFPILSLSSSSNQEGLQNVPNINMLQSIVNAVKKTLTKYRKQTEENNSKFSSLNEQTTMQQRTIEFLEDERQKMQQLNSQLSSQFESV
ncbi:rootletin [Trichonephila inaurata madagascariensis]|uniref:Rootletin n=1 Tax=Trichonephila inaurata madagascariensis TaxID=2747483 RepID=A0A8X6XU23_9ARAC|nr:rootletin [Trichonephila inaurata madagascariensis]